MNSNLAELVSFCRVTKQPQSERLTTASWGHDNVGQQFGLGSTGQFFVPQLGSLRCPRSAGRLAGDWLVSAGLSWDSWSQPHVIFHAPHCLLWQGSKTQNESCIFS